MKQSIPYHLDNVLDKNMQPKKKSLGNNQANPENDILHTTVGLEYSKKSLIKEWLTALDSKKPKRYKNQV